MAMMLFFLAINVTTVIVSFCCWQWWNYLILNCYEILFLMWWNYMHVDNTIRLILKLPHDLVSSPALLYEWFMGISESHACFIVNCYSMIYYFSLAQLLNDRRLERVLLKKSRIRKMKYNKLCKWAPSIKGASCQCWP